ncbi:MAG: deoxyribodipyrimidine photolyase [Actinobacteria bacterium HGW-Actinobacteria-6]|nr:MAG: deoxyribodipyrimidine photolyase [Actinobacteria bacterium HGW-Actinobacteria-6]
MQPGYRPRGARVGTGTAVVWLRNDLRLSDNPALSAAAESYDSVAPVFVWSPDEAGAWSPGTASRSWLALSLASLFVDIGRLGGHLSILAGPTASALLAFARTTGATAVYWNRRYEPALAALDAHVERRLAAAGVRVHVFAGSLLREPEALTTGSGSPYQVFTPFMNAGLRAAPVDPPIAAPSLLVSPHALPAGLRPQDIAGTSRSGPDLSIHWSPGESGAASAAASFFSEIVGDYGENRNHPDRLGTSRLSPHIAFGEISPRTLLQRANAIVSCNGSCHISAGAEAFVRQLHWREFAYHLLHYHPHTPERPLRARFDVFPWSRDPDALEAWQSGMTGYPIVDAGMRELLATGWMHNRVRMLVASLLTKDLLLPWVDGARWFWERLADADLANNTFGWQWVAGCGADAAPYFRIFNPVLQGERFDTDGAYVKRWIPELEALPAAWVHRPWGAPSGVLASAGITLGREYPQPIVDHASARLRALAVYGSLRDIVK